MILVLKLLLPLLPVRVHQLLKAGPLLLQASINAEPTIQLPVHIEAQTIARQLHMNLQAKGNCRKGLLLVLLDQDPLVRFVGKLVILPSIVIIECISHSRVVTLKNSLPWWLLISLVFLSLGIQILVPQTISLLIWIISLSTLLIMAPILSKLVMGLLFLFLILDKTSGKMLFQGPIEQGLYPIRFAPSVVSHNGTKTSLLSKCIPTDIWHCRLGHPSSTIKRAILSLFSSSNKQPLSSSDLNNVQTMKALQSSVAAAALPSSSDLNVQSHVNVAAKQASFPCLKANVCPSSDLHAGADPCHVYAAAKQSSSSCMKADASSSVLHAVADPSSYSDLKHLQASKMTDSWSSLFHKRTDRSRDLHHHSNPSTDPDHHIVFDEEDASVAVQNWGNSLVGYFIGKVPPLPDIKSSLEKAWRMKDLELIPMADGFLLFKFHSYDAGQQLLDEGPWFVYGKPLILRRWAADISMCRDNLETIPVWVRLPNLNFCFRSTSALSKIATVIGNPICMDHATATGTRYAFARICVEVGIDYAFPTQLQMKYKEKTIIQKVEYAWRPHPCKTCRTFNHADNSCPLKPDQHKPKQVWVPKKTISVDKPASDVDVGVGVVANVDEGTPCQPDEVQCGIQHEELQSDLALVGWNVVKGKHGSAKTGSPVPSQSSSKRSTKLVTVEPNRFLSLSNLDGDSSVGAAELSATTAIVLSASGHGLSDTGQVSGQVLHSGSAAPGQVNGQSIVPSQRPNSSSVQDAVDVVQCTSGLQSKAPSPVQSTAGAVSSHLPGAKLLVRQPGLNPKQKHSSSGVAIKERATLKPVSK